MWLVRSHRALLVQAARYGLVGIANTIFGLSIILLLLMTTSIDGVAANAAGFAAGLFLSFVLNARWTFRVAEPWGFDTFTRFLLGFAIAYGINLVVLIFLTSAGLSAYLANAVSVAVYAVTFFTISRLFVFKKRPCNPAQSS